MPTYFLSFHDLRRICQLPAKHDYAAGNDDAGVTDMGLRYNVKPPPPDGVEDECSGNLYFAALVP